MMVVAGLAQGPCPRGPLVRIPITSLTKSPSPGMMVITDSCLNQMYVFPDSVTTGGDVVNQYFAGDTLVTVLANGDTLISISNAITGVNYDNDTLCIYTSQGDTFCTVIAIDGDTSGTGRVRLLDNLGVEDTLMTNAAPTAPDNLTLSNAVRLEVPNTIKWGGDLVDATTTVHSPDSSHNITYQDINLERHYGASHRFYPWSSFIIDGGTNAYFQMSSRTSFYIRADTVLQLDLYQHLLSDSSHLLIRTDRLRKAIAKPGAFMQLLSDTPGTYQGDSDWSKYQLPLSSPVDTGNYVLNFDGDEFTFQEAPNPSVGGSGTLNYVVKWTPDGNTLGNSQIFDNGTNVGIGTLSSIAKLEVASASTSVNDTVFYVKNGTAGEINLIAALADGQVYINSNAGSDLTNIGTTTGPVSFNYGYNNTFRFNLLTFYGTNISNGIQGFQADPGIAIGYAQSTINPNTGSPFSVKAKSATAGSPIQVWDNNAGTDIAAMREDGYLNFGYAVAGGIVFENNLNKGVFFDSSNSNTSIYSNFTAHNFRLWNGSAYAQRAYLNNTGLLIGSSGTAVRDFHTAGTARITASVDTATVAHFWMGNTVGDLRKVNIGSDFVVQGDSLKVQGGGSLPAGSVLNSTLRWDGTDWVENDSLLANANGEVAAGGAAINTARGITTIKDIDIYGIRAGRGDSADSTNTVFGRLALNKSTPGTKNSTFGVQAGENVTGLENTYIGYRTGRTNVTGNYNTAIGATALQLASSNGWNTAIGHSALFNASGPTTEGNTAVGFAALASNSVGLYNTAIGYGAGQASSSKYSIFIGFRAGYTTSKDSTLHIGATSIDSVATIIGNLREKRVGINLAAWGVKRQFHVNGDLRINTDVDTATLTQIWAGNNEGDLRRVIPGDNLSFTGDTLNANANADLFEYPHGSTYYTDTEFPRSKTLTTGQTDTVEFAVAGPGDYYPGSQFVYNTDGQFIANFDSAYIEKWECTPCIPQYEMQFNVAMSIASADTLNSLLLKVYHNGSPVETCTQETFVEAGNRPINISTTCHLRMVDTDVIDVRLQNSDSGSRTFTIKRLTANIHQVGFSYWESP